MPLDARTLRRLLTPFEFNCFQLVAHYGNDPQKIAQVLRGGNESLTSDGRFGKDGMTIKVVGRDSSVTAYRVREALAEASRKLAARVDAKADTTEGAASNGHGEEPEEKPELRRDDPLEKLRDTMPPMRSKDPQAEQQRKKSGAAAQYGERAKIGKRQRAVLDYLAEHGPSRPAEVREAIDLRDSAQMANIATVLVDRGLAVRHGTGRGVILALPDQDLTEAAKAEPEANAGAAAGEPRAQSVSAPRSDSPAEPPSGRKLEEGRYLDALLKRIATIESCEEHVFDRAEQFVSGGSSTPRLG